MEKEVTETIALLLGILFVNVFVLGIGCTIYNIFNYVKKRNKYKTSVNNIEINIKNNKIMDANKYENKQFLTNCETEFFYKLKKLEDELNVRIQPQINLGTIVQKTENNKYRNELFRNIDFGIFTKNYEKLLLLIELNDSTHNNYKTIARDKKVKEICKEANIKLITFYTKYPNTSEYIKNRIIKEISQ